VSCHRYVSSVFLCREDGGRTFLPNTAEFLLDYVASQVGHYLLFSLFLPLSYANSVCMLMDAL
jgi:hypothetical protein